MGDAIGRVVVHAGLASDVEDRNLPGDGFDQPVWGRMQGPSMVTVWQRSRRRLNSALVNAGLARKSGQVGYGRFVVISVGFR